ncbi:MAG: TrkH family potassium uptake protein [Burkholderiaceae bacterium]|nr:TrkH family potassium uptake protein [Burkholderiaceae bacterium]
MLSVLRILGLVITLFSLALLLPLAFAFFSDESISVVYGETMLITVVSGALLTGLCWWHRRELYPREGFLLVALVWLVLPAFAAIPFLRAFGDITFAQAYFEATSGLTTTGATVLTGLDDMPRSILVWRSFMQWLGGMGILILALAILPLLGVGGMQIYRAEMPGPIKDSKLTPRIAETAKLLYGIYLYFSIACFFAYWIAGMTAFDAFIHTGSTMSLGGLSSHDSSFAHFDNPAIELVAVWFMLLAGVNFASHAVALQRQSVQPYFADIQARWFWFTAIAGSGVVGLFLFANGVYPSALESLRHALFNTVSVATGTGFSTQDYGLWPPFAAWFIVFLSAFAASSGSTGSGIKMIRLIVLFKQAQRELLQIVHPRLVSPVQLDGTPVSDRVIFAILAYMLFYGATIMVASFLLLMSGMDAITAVSATLASVNNLGPGLGEVGPSGNYAGLTSFQLWVCAITMLLGRLELLTLLVVLIPSFWRE